MGQRTSGSAGRCRHYARAPQCPSAMAGPRFTGSIHLDVNNVDELWESLKTRARVVHPIETTEYGLREFGLLDDNDYQLSFAEYVAPN